VRLDRLAVRPLRAAARSGRGILSDEAERAVDGVLAGPLPESVARSLAAHNVIERFATELLDTGASSEQLEAVLEQVLRSSALEKWVTSGEAGRLMDPLVDRVLRSAALKETMFSIVESPQLRHALSHQTKGFGDEVAAAARARAVRSDDAVEGRIHRWLRLRRADGPRPFAGFATRAVGLVIDAVLAQVAFLVGAGSLIVVGSLVGASETDSLMRSFAGAIWLIAGAAYFAGFWSSSGQTPGMRLMGIRVVDRNGTPPSLLRSLLRFVAFLLAIVPLFAGFLTVFVDRRRRALHDLIARTVVLHDDDPSSVEPDLLEVSSVSSDLPAETPPAASVPRKRVVAAK